MDTSADRRIADMEGEGALPRKNGELVFEAPWEGRAFGLAVALNESGLYQWRAFVDRLIAEIATVREHGAPSSYYERWVASLEQLIVARGLVTKDELDTRTAEYESGAREDDG